MITQLLAQTSWWVPAYGLAGALMTLPWSVGLVRRTGPRPAAYFNILATVLAVVHSSLLLWAVWDMPPMRSLVPWFSVPGFDIWLTLVTSKTSVAAAVFVSVLSLLAQVYALGYMEKDWALARFFSLMGFFEAAMSGIALSDSLFLSYALLEMLTLSTYLLVGFWYAQPLVVTAARDAFLTKRAGDLLLLMGVIALSTMAGSMDFTHLDLWAQTVDMPAWVATLLGLALMAGPTGKCAQYPLNLWLDEAMEGPNPASILRNSVVVGCGCYVLINLQPVLALSPTVLTVLMVLGGLTALGASLVSIAQVDIKRTLAHSTSAYLGLVFLAVGMQQDELALTFLFVHGVAKALQFMSIGSIIMTTSTQNLTEMGGLGSRMPATTLAFIVGGLATLGLPPLGGFWMMLTWAEDIWAISPWLVTILLAVNGLTAFNLVRVFGLVFWGDPKPKTRRAPEVPWLMALPMVSLTFFNFLVPALLQQWHALPHWDNPNRSLVFLLVLSSLVGAGLGGWFYLSKRSTSPATLVWQSLRYVLAYDFCIDRLYKFSVVLGVVLGSRLTNWFDRYIVDGLVNFVGVASIFSGESLKYTISGQSRNYLLSLFVGVLLALAAVAWTFLRLTLNPL